MRKATLMLAALLMMGISTAAQTGNANPSSASQNQSKKAKDQVAVRGCVEKQNTDYILTQADQGNSYELQGSGKVKRLGPYLGQQVEVTGVTSPSLATSSDSLARTGAASPITITVTSIKTIAKRCSGD